MRLGRRERDFLDRWLGQRRHLGYGRQRLATPRRRGRQARQQGRHHGIGLGPGDGADDAHLGPAGLDQAVHLPHVLHADALQGRLGRVMPIGMAAIHGGRVGAAGQGGRAGYWLRESTRPAAGARVARWLRERPAHPSAWPPGAPPWATGRGRSAIAGKNSCGPSPRSHRSRRPGRPRLHRAGSRPRRARRSRASMPLEIMPAVTLARPALSAGSRRPPASNSMRTSTMGIEGLSTRYTLAPLGCVHCWIGIAASACAAAQQQAQAQDSGCHRHKSLLVAQARRGRARFAIRIHRLGPQHAYGELVIAEVFGGDGLHLLRSDTAQALDQPVGSHPAAGPGSNSCRAPGPGC